MKLTELLTNQKVNVQLLWGEQKIEFASYVTEKEDGAVYVTPYLHRDSALELNITRDKGVVCNLFADHPATKRRISWKNVELTTVNRDNGMVYCIKTYGFNTIALPDDRRLHERILMQVDAIIQDGKDGDEERVTIRDISDIGLSFYTRKGFQPKSQQIVVNFSDMIEQRVYDIQVECTISRISVEEDHNVIGCRLIGENKNYQIYGLMKRLRAKSAM